MIRLIKADFLEAVPRLDDESIDLFLIDIPYNISKENNFNISKSRIGNIPDKLF